MFDKIKIAGILLVVGMVAGLAIVGVHTLTEDRIEENRLAMQYEDYVSIFPDMDLTNYEEKALDQDVLTTRITAYDSDGDFLGYIFIGESASYGGTNRVLVGVDSDGRIVKVILSQTQDTANIVQNVIDILDKFEGQAFGEVDYDAPSGATQSYDSIWRVVDAVSLMIEGDPTQEAFESVFEDADSYDVLFDHEDLAFVEEFNIRDADGTILGYAYEIDVDDENTVFLVVDQDDVFKGFVPKDAVDDETQAMIEAYDDHIDTPLVDIDPDTGDILEDAINDLKPLVETTTRVDYDIVVRYKDYIEDDEVVGVTYIVRTDGYNARMIGEVTIVDDELFSFVIRSHNESADWGAIIIDDGDLQEALIDADNPEDVDVKEYTTFDATSGATQTGEAMQRIVVAALEYHNEEGGQ